MANNSINFNIGFKVNDSGLKQARTALDQFLNNGVNAKQLSLINQQDLNTSLKMIGDATKEVGKFEEAMTQAYNVKLGTVNLERFNEELEKNGTSLQSFKEKMMQLGPTGQQTYAQMASGLMNVKYETVETTTLLDKLGESLRRSLLTFTSINIINKVKGSIGEAYGYVKNLDNSLNDIRIVTGKSADEMDRFAEKANKAAASLGKATTDYTKASTIFYQQGLGNEEVEARTEVALKVANTTGADTSKAADQLTAIWNGFNVGAEDAEKSIDVVAAVAANTASNLDEMATAMSKVASMANSMGVSEEQLAAQISTVIAVTRQAPESVGTAFKTIYARIADIKAGSEDAEISLGNYSGQLSALGINVLDTAGNLKDMGQVIEEVGASWGNYSKEQQVAIAGIMGGQRQVNQIRALFDNWDKYTETMKIAAEAEGTLQQQQDTYMESTEGQLQKLRTEWEGVLDSLLKSEDIIKVVKGASPLVQGLEKVVDALGGGIGILQKFSPLLFSLVSPQISQGIGKMASSFQAAQTNARLAEQQINVWNATMQNTQFTDKYANSIKQIGKDYVNLMNTMSAEQRNDFQASMQRFVDVTSKEVSEKFSEIAALQQKLSQKGLDINPIGAEEDIGSIIDKLRELENASNVQLNVTFPDGTTIWSKLRDLQDIYGNDLPQSVKNFQDALFAAQSAETGEINITDDLRQAYAAMQNELNGTSEDVEGLKQAIRDYIKTLQDADQQHQRINQTVNSLKIEQFATSVMQITQGFVALRSAISQVIELGNIWDDEDLTASEKMSQTLTTIASILTMTIPSLITAGKAISSLSTAHLAAAGAAEVQAGAEGVATGATNGLTIAIGTLKLTMWELVAIVAIAALAIGGIIALVKAWGKAHETSVEKLERANKKLEEATKKYNELNSAIADYREAKKGLDNLTEGTVEFAEAITDLNSKVLKLIGTYPELAQYMEVGEHGEMFLNEEGLKEYIELQKKALALEQQNTIAESLYTQEDRNKVKKEDQVIDIQDPRVQERYNQLLEEYQKKEDYNINSENYQQDAENQAIKEVSSQVNNQSQKLLEQYDKADRTKIASYLKAYESFADISKNTAAAIAQDLQNEYKDDTEGLKAAMADEDAMLSRAEEYRKQAVAFSNNNFNFSGADLVAGDFSKVSEQDLKNLWGNKQLIAMMLGVDEQDQAVTDFLSDLQKAVEEKIKELPSPFKKWSEDIDLGIAQDFAKDYGKISDEVLQELGNGFENLGYGIDKIDFSKELSTIDWSSENGIAEFEEYLKSIGLIFDKLPSEIKAYIKAQQDLNGVYDQSVSKLQALSSDIKKIKDLNFGDSLKTKDYEELIALHPELESFFKETAEGFMFIGNSGEEALKKIQKEYKKTKKELEEQNAIFKNLNSKSAFEEAIGKGQITKEQATSYLGYDSVSDFEKATAKDVYDKNIVAKGNWYQQLIEYDKKYALAYIDTLDELEKATYLSEEARLAVSEDIKNKEITNLGLTKKAYEAYVKEIKSQEKNNNLSDKQIIARLKLDINGEELIKQVTDTLEDLPNKTGGELALAASEMSKIFSEDFGINLSADFFTKDNLSLINQMFEGSDEAFNKIQIKVQKELQRKIGQAYQSGNIKLAEELEGELSELSDFWDILLGRIEKSTETTIKKLQQELKKTNLEQQKTLLETQKSLTENRRGKVENRMAHASGSEYLTLSKSQKGYREQEFSLLQQTQNLDLQILQCEKEIAEQEALALGLDKEQLGMTYEQVQASDLEADKKRAILAIRGYDVELQAKELTNAQELEDFYEKQYVTIDKLASTNAQRTKSERELAKLQREEKGLSGKELLENRKKQREVEQQILEDKKEALEIQRETVEDSKNALTKALLDVNVKLDYDENVGILNRTEILEALNGKYDEATIEAITHLMDELDDNTDQLYDLQEEIADAEQVIAAASDTDENTKIKSNNDRIAQLQNEQKKFAEGSPEWFEKQKKINEYKADNVNQLESKVIDAAYKDFGGIELQDNNYKLGSSTYIDKYKDYIGSKFENINIDDVELDEFGRIINREKLIANGADADAIDAINEAVDKYMDKVNDLQDAQSDFIANNPYQEVELSVKKAEKSEQDLQKAQQNLTAEVQKTSTAMSQLQSDASFLYGDDLVANLEAQNRCLEEQQRLTKEQIELDKEAERIAQEKLTAAEKKKGIDEDALKNAKKYLNDSIELPEGKTIDDYIDAETKALDTNALAELRELGIIIDPQLIEDYNKALEKWNTSEKEYNTALKESQDAQNKTLQDLAAENKLTNDILNKRREIAQAKLKTAEDAIKRETSADHKLSKALLDVDEAINKVKRSQNGLTGPALISAMQQEVALQQQKKVILEQQKAQIDAQIQSLIKLYSLHLSTEYGISVGFNVDETGVTNVDALYKSIENLDEKVKGAAMQDIQNFISTLNGLAGNALSAKKSVDSLGDSIEDLNKKIEETQKAELFRVKEERWSSIDQELKKIARELSRVEKLQKNLTGDALIKNLEHQQQLLEKQAEAQKNKLGIMKAELQTMQTMLALEGVLFTSDGLIANYAAVMAKGDEKLKGYMQSYQQFYDQIGDLEDSILDTYDKKADLEAEKMAERLRMFNTKIDIELDLTKAKREWQNFKREFLNTLNDMSRLNDSIAEKCKQNVKDIKDMTVKDTVMLTDHVNDIIQEIKIMQAGGTSDLYGIDQATALSDLANYRQQLQDTLSSLADKIKETEEAFLQQLEKIKSKFDDQIGNYETIQSIIEHDMNLIKLLRGDDAYDELANYYDKSTKNYEAELQTLRQQVDYWKNLMDSAQPGTEEWEKFQSNWKDALNKLNSAVDAAVQNLIDKYKNAINKIMADFEKKITNGSSLDTAKQRWDWQKQQADFFLDTITKEYEIEKLRMKINKAAEDESDPAKRARILQIGDKQLKQLQSLTKVRQYDVDLANKQLELELKKQELEDAKNQKTSMRLRRDAEGNYRYEYVADQDKIDELKESILDAEQDIYEFTVKNQRDLQDQMYENVKEFEDAIRDLVSRRSQMTEDEYNAELQRIKDHFGFMDDAIRDALDKAAVDVTDAATTEAVDLGLLYQEQLDKMSELQRRKFAEDIVPTFISAITEMKDIIDGEGGLINAAKFAFDELDSAFNELQAQLNDIQAAAGVDFEAIAAGVDDTINEMQALIEDNDELLVQYQEELDVIRDLIDELHDLMDAYRDVYDAAMDAIDVALELRETAREAMEEYNDLNSLANSGDSSAAGASSTSGDKGVPAGNYAAKKNSQYIGVSGLATYKKTYYHAGIDENGNTKIFSSEDSSTFASIKPGQTYVAKDGTEYKMYGNENTTNIDTARREAEILEDDKQYAAHMAGKFDTGGYTGAWGNEGKIAVLHEKELVLNKDDTRNILRAVTIARQGSQMGLSTQDFSVMTDIMIGIHNLISDIYAALVNDSSNALMQQAAAASTITSMNNSNVTNNINANFPNAGNMNEIKSAIMGLSNYASQKIHSNQRVKSTTTPNAYRAKSF